MKVDGTNYLNSVVNGGDASCGQGTGMVPLDANTHIASEAAGANTIFENYTKRVTCVDSSGTVLVNNVVAITTNVDVNRGDQVVCTFTNTLLAGQLAVKKVLDPSDDPGKFNLYIKDAAQVVRGSATDAGNNGTTGPITLLQNTYTVGETAGTGTSLANYTASITCRDQAGSIVAGPQSGSGPLSVNLLGSGNILCTITNQRSKGKLEVRKTIDPSSDTGKFDLFIDGTTYINGGAGFGHGGSTNEQMVNTGAHQVGESQHSGTLLGNYSSSISCQDNNGAGAVVASGAGVGPLNVNVNLNDDIVCVVTNTRKPQLKLVKTIVPAADAGKFNLFIKQGGITVTVPSGSVSNIGDGGSVGFLTLNPGTYTVSETQGTPNDGLGNYSTGINCDKPGFVPVTGINAGIDGIVPDPALVAEPLASIELANGESITCTITNTRKARMPLTKTVNSQATAAQFTLSLYPDLGGSHVNAAIFPSSAGTPLASINGPVFPSIIVLGGPFVVCEMGTFNGVSTSDGFPSGSAASWTVNGVAITAGGVSVPPGGTATGNLTVAVFDPEIAILQPTKNRTCISGIELKAGGVISIALNNTPPGQIIVKKLTVPAGDAVTSFPFTADYNANGFSLKHGETHASPFLAPGTYNISETGTAGYELTGINCQLTKTGVGTSQFPLLNAVVQPVAITLASGDEVTCTFTNTKQAKISVEKICVGGASGTFGFTATPDGGNSSNVNVDCGQKTTLVAPTINFVNWTIAESTIPPGWDLTSIQCTGDTNVQYVGASAVAHLDAGDDVNCKFTNTRRGALTIVKDAVYGPGTEEDQDFTFTPENLAGDTFLLDDVDGHLPNSKQFSNLPANNTALYSVSETLPANGWGLMNITCVDAEAGDDGNLTVQSDVTFDGFAALSAFQGGKNRVNVKITPGEHLTCTFRNVELGQILVAKQTIPDGDTTLFTFNSNNIPGFPTAASNPDNKLMDGESFMVINVFPGTHHVTEAQAADWDVHVDSFCNDTDSTINIGSRQATYIVGVGETVDCTFVNEKRGHIIVDKVTIPPGVLDVFHFDANGGSNPAYRDFSLRDQDPPNDQSLRPGVYTVAELVHAGFDLHNIHCELIVVGVGTSTFPLVDSTNQPVVIDLKSGDTVMCTFTNKRKPMLVLNKIARFGDDRFPFELTDRGTQEGPEDDSTSTVSVRTAKPYYDENGNRIGTTGQEIVYLAPGHTYDLLENLAGLPDWYMNNVSCTFQGSTLDGVPNPELEGYPDHPIVYNDLVNPPFPRERNILPVRLEDFRDGQPRGLEYLDIVTCTFTNTQEAIMPLNKLINGCQPNANENSNKCGEYPAFTFNLYAQNPVPVADPLDANVSHIVPYGFPVVGLLGTVTAPPRVELPGPTGLPFSVCEMGVPNAWENLSWTVEITMYGSNKPDQIITFYPYDPTQVRPDFYNPDYFLSGVEGANSGNRCINVTIPLGTDRFEIFVNNVTGRGRMTGGGSAFTTLNQQSTRVTHGFQLHCNANDDPNNLEINWNGNRFHLESLTSARCTTDRRLEGTNRPAAGFNTFEGVGTGRYNGDSGYKATWVFTDAGEPGTNDTMALRITNAAGTTTILTVGTINTNGNGGIVNSTGVALTFGNHQAHK